MPDFDLDSALAEPDGTEFSDQCPHPGCGGTLIADGYGRFSSRVSPEGHIWAKCSRRGSLHEFRVSYKFTGKSIDRNPLPDNGRVQGECPVCDDVGANILMTDFLGITAEGGGDANGHSILSRVFSRCRCRTGWHNWSDVYEFTYRVEDGG